MNGPEMIEFADAVWKALSFDDLDTVLKRLNLDITRYIVAQQTFPEQVKCVVARANAENWIGSLVSEVVRERSRNVAIQTFLQNNPHWNADRYPVAAHPCDTLFVLGGKAFIGRKDFREYLKAMNSPTGKKVLLITSDRRRVGKTYSRELIEFLVDGQQFASVIAIDTDQEDYDPRKLTKKIGQQMGVAGEPPDQAGQQAPRWAQELVSWLIPNTPGGAAVWWIVLDGFRQRMPSEAMQELISQLAQRVQSTSRFRLLLVNYGYQLPLRVHAFAFKEQVRPLEKCDIESFLAQLHERRHGAHPRPPDIVQWVDAVDARLTQYKGLYPEEADDQLLLNMAVTDTAELI